MNNTANPAHMIEIDFFILCLIPHHESYQGLFVNIARVKVRPISSEPLETVFLSLGCYIFHHNWPLGQTNH